MAWTETRGYFCLTHATFFTDLGSVTGHMTVANPCDFIPIFRITGVGAQPQVGGNSNITGLLSQDVVPVSTSVPANGVVTLAAVQAPPHNHIMLYQVSLPGWILNGFFARVAVQFEDGSVTNLDNATKAATTLQLADIIGLVFTGGNVGKRIRTLSVQLVNTTGVVQVGVLGTVSLRGRYTLVGMGVIPGAV